jgi:hypothetical protein
MQIRECKIYRVRWDNNEKEGSDMEPKDFFFFDKMLTPKVITIIYWLALIGVVIGALTYMFTVSFLTGLLALVGGLVAVRIWCELAVIFFKMNEALQAIRNR